MTPGRGPAGPLEAGQTTAELAVVFPVVLATLTH